MSLPKISWLILLALYAPLSTAELNDRNQPLQIEADQVVMNDALQVSTFTGNVQIKQGTLELHGDKIVVTQDKQGYKVGKIYGSVASFRQKREGLNEYDEGYGERIEYDTHSQILDIYGQARLKRNQDFIHGDHINYNAQSEIFIVNNSAPAKGAPPHRVKAIIQSHPKDAPANDNAQERK